ncbi:MAG: hypothetical protein AB8C02_12035 [Halioglobus sp.]
MRNFLHTLPPAGQLTQWAGTLSLILMLGLGTLSLPIEAEESGVTTLDVLTEQRQTLTLELEQYEETLALLNPGGELPATSKNPAVRKLAHQAMLTKERLLAIAAQEVTLLQQQIHGRSTAGTDVANTVGIDDDEVLIASERYAATASVEGKPLRTLGPDYTSDKDAENVERLHVLLEDYFAQVQASANVLPTDDEVLARERAKRDADALAKIPYSADKVHLSGQEGSTALAHITRRLMNPAIPESRRDTSPICAIKTYLFDTLVASENRSLQPVGKNHYVARLRLQPGETTLNIQKERWEVSIPQQTTAKDYLITFYKPPGRDAQMHLLAIEDLLALDSPHIPAWLPKELDIQINNQG